MIDRNIERALADVEPRIVSFTETWAKTAHDLNRYLDCKIELRIVTSWLSCAQILTEKQQMTLIDAFDAWFNQWEAKGQHEN